MHFQAGKYFLSTGVEVFLEMTALIEVVYTPVSDTPLPPPHLLKPLFIDGPTAWESRNHHKT